MIKSMKSDPFRWCMQQLFWCHLVRLNRHIFHFFVKRQMTTPMWLLKTFDSCCIITHLQSQYGLVANIKLMSSKDTWVEELDMCLVEGPLINLSTMHSLILQELFVDQVSISPTFYETSIKWIALKVLTFMFVNLW